ncbi:urea permease [Scheffersomyces xylosifermentans]|uniref:urea permease n=1 Tax=Scheffersomyces xylosifermentans TaxID=1304137 RepID=UPI00315CC1A0
MEPTLSQGVAYGLIIGGGAFFAIVMNYFTHLQNKYSKFNSNKIDEFVSGSRSIGFGLLLSGILSNWTWSLTLLESAVKSYSIGISGGYWYGIGGLLQVSVFSVISSKIKKNANLVTTFPEMGYFRFGRAGHLSFLWCGFICNAIVSSCILLGGSAVFSAITGINEYATLFLIPFGVAVYVSFGGLRATFISDATHTCIILVFLIVFMFQVYVTNDKIGSPEKMWELLNQLAPVEDNFHGSYLTFRSKQGAIFSIVSVITGFGLVVNDQAYLSRAVAADPRFTSRAYFFASVCWFIIPLSIGTSLGLAARALSAYPDFPSLSEFEVGEGLPAVAAASYLMGKSGSAMMLVMIFFSVTSSFAGELIGTSTLLSYDVYKRYYKPDATPKEVVLAAKVFVFVWAILASSLASIFYGAAKISMGWLFNFLGVATASGVFPIGLSFTWKHLNKAGAVGGSVGGMLLAVIVWLITCKTYKGDINVTNLTDPWVSLAGNVTALVMGGVIAITASLIRPANFNFEDTRNRTSLAEKKSEEIEVASSSFEVANEISSEKKDATFKVNEEEDSGTTNDSDLDMDLNQTIDHKHLDRQFKKYCGLVGVLAVIMAIVIPVPLGASPYVFSPGFLKGFIVVLIIWLFFSFTYVVLVPIFEARKTVWRIIKQVFSFSFSSSSSSE